jgi:hypothetical protein
VMSAARRRREDSKCALESTIVHAITCIFCAPSLKHPWPRFWIWSLRAHSVQSWIARP